MGAAQAWVHRIHDDPDLWADGADRALITAVLTLYPTARRWVDE